jgi:hypothetical protein
VVITSALHFLPKSNAVGPRFDPEHDHFLSYTPSNIYRERERERERKVWSLLAFHNFFSLWRGFFWAKLQPTYSSNWSRYTLTVPFNISRRNSSNVSNITYVRFRLTTETSPRYDPSFNPKVFSNILFPSVSVIVSHFYTNFAPVIIFSTWPSPASQASIADPSGHQHILPFSSTQSLALISL